MDNLQITDERLSLAVTAATRGGEHAQKKITSVDQEQKADSTIVTEADRQIDQKVRTFLTAESEFDVLSEEQGQDELLDDESYWVVDPIDGTQNYAYQQPLYGTAVGLIQDGTPTVGCFYMPELDDLFYACAGHGAYRNQTEVTVTDETDLEAAYLVGSGMGSSEHYKFISDLNPWVQRFGCGVQAEAFIAAGLLDAGIFGALKPWDIAAGAAIVREAGGIVTRLDGAGSAWDDIAHGGVVMANPQLAETIVDALPDEAITALSGSYESFVY